jgi:hypothetical protein
MTTTTAPRLRTFKVVLDHGPDGRLPMVVIATSRSLAITEALEWSLANGGDRVVTEAKAITGDDGYFMALVPSGTRIVSLKAILKEAGA